CHERNSVSEPGGAKSAAAESEADGRAACADAKKKERRLSGGIPQIRQRPAGVRRCAQRRPGGSPGGTGFLRQRAAQYGMRLCPSLSDGGGAVLFQTGQ